jgi:NAD(P)H dehydrogenase (quinone)
MRFNPHKRAQLIVKPLNMHILVVFCHPSKTSFTYQVFEHLLAGLKAGQHTIVVSDLYAIDFKSDMSEAEYAREGFGQVNLAVPDDVRLEQQKIQKADAIIFVYPVWWSDCPAKLKGWFDRVYTVGYAYGYDAVGNKQIKMNKPKLGLALCTAGHPNQCLEENGIAQSMRQIMVNDRLGPRFENKELVIFGGTIAINTVRQQHLEKAFSIGQKLEYYTTL